LARGIRRFPWLSLKNYGTTGMWLFRDIPRSFLECDVVNTEIHVMMALMYNVSFVQTPTGWSAFVNQGN
jgi:hypothetical protein